MSSWTGSRWLRKVRIFRWCSSIRLVIRSISRFTSKRFFGKISLAFKLKDANKDLYLAEVKSWMEGKIGDYLG